MSVVQSDYKNYHDPPEGSEFDWVEKRAKCDFSLLRKVIEADVSSACKHAPSSGEIELDDLSDPSGEAFMVSRVGPNGARCFYRNSDLTVTVTDCGRVGPDRPPIIDKARIVLSEAGDYMVEVDGREPMRLWQFSRLVLEGIFFP